VSLIEKLKATGTETWLKYWKSFSREHFEARGQRSRSTIYM